MAIKSWLHDQQIVFVDNKSRETRSCSVRDNLFNLYWLVLNQLELSFYFWRGTGFRNFEICDSYRVLCIITELSMG